MPNRVIRDGLLDSERYWSCTIEARELYRHLQLIADDFGCLSLSYVFLRRRCFDSAPSAEKLAKLIGELVDHDLVRRYEIANAVYGFLPRFGQRLRRMSLKHPKPPDELLADDEYALEIFGKINNKTKNPSDIRPSSVGHPSVTRPSRDGQPSAEVEVEVKRIRREVEVESKGREAEGKGIGALSALAAKLGLKPFDGEELEHFKTRLYNFQNTIQQPKPKGANQ